MKYLRQCSIILITLTLIACSSADIQPHATTEPTLSVRDFFTGQLVAHGLVKNYSGEVIRHFSADIEASWAGDIGTLDVTVDDRMFLVTENRIINESIFSKFGIQVASVQLVIEKIL